MFTIEPHGEKCKSKPLPPQTQFISAYYEALDCPRALTCWLLFKYEEHVQLAKMEWFPQDYEGLPAARDSLAASKFLSKATFLNTGINLQEAAVSRFVDAEKQCEVTNHRLDTGTFDFEHTRVLLSRAEKICRKILGELDANEFVDNCGWGPGSTTLIPRREASAPNKFQVETGITKACYDFVSPWFHLAFPTWNPFEEGGPPLPGDAKRYRGASKIVTVPKDAKTDRTIAIEPGINLFFQKGVGAVLRSRLRGIGINLNDQSYNQRKSRLGSKYDQLATVDFASASDTVSYNIVRRLLPENWFKLMSALRSTHGHRAAPSGANGFSVEFEKFSSMGNGFTFELETLLFYVLAIVSCEHVSSQLGIHVGSDAVSVYGDDVIIPSAAYDVYVKLCADCGFTTNKTKSYDKGNYRESCGEHYWNGRCITPFYMKEPLNGKTALFKCANSVRRLAHRRNDFGCDVRLLRSWQILCRSIKGFTPEIPDGYGDGGLVMCHDEVTIMARDSVPRKKQKLTIVTAGFGTEGFLVPAYAVRPEVVILETHGVLLSKLKDLGVAKDHTRRYQLNDMHEELFFLREIEGVTAGFGNEIPLPGLVKGIKSRLFVPRWPVLGPWV